MAKLNVDIWAEGEVIKAFKFSDGYKYTGADAAQKLNDHFTRKARFMPLGKMKIHPWKPIAAHLN